MKKLLLILAVIGLVAVAGIGLFIATFDVDRYRPQLISRLEQLLGRPVELERVSLGWKQGIALQLHGVVIHQDQAAQLEPLVEVESVNAVVRLLPLLQKDVQVSSVVLIRPRIYVARDAQGNLNLTQPADDARPTVEASTAPAGTPRLQHSAAAPTAAAPRAPGPEGGEPAAVEAGGTPISFHIASLRIKEGALHWADAMSTPPTDLWLTKLDVTVRNIAVGQPMDLTITGALGGETPNISLSGQFTLPGPSHPGSLEAVQLTVTQLPLETIMPPAPADAPQLRGLLTVTLQGETSTLDPAMLSRAVSGRGVLRLDEPAILNLNVLREVFNQLSMLPGLADRLYARLPPEYQAKFDATDTILEPVELSVTLADGVLRFDDVTVQTDTFGVSGPGTVSLDGMVVMHATLRVDSMFSAALVSSVHELQALNNADGEMEIPLTISGPVTQIAVQPDLRYVTSKVVVTSAMDLLGQLLKKETGSDEGAEAGDQPASPESALLERFLRGVLAPSE